MDVRFVALGLAGQRGWPVSVNPQTR